MEELIKIKKYSGNLVEFDLQKLLRSLRRTKADEDLILKVAAEVQRTLYDGISTKQIYQSAYKILNRAKAKSFASRYKLKKAIMELGPTGFPFEKYVAALLDFEGFQTKVGIIVQGNCVTHEVDVLAKKDQKNYIIECKYHNRQGRVNDVKIPLYIQSRFLDVKKGLTLQHKGNSEFYEGWIYTNTRFSSDAVQFANCIGLKLVSWDYPENKSLQDKINKSKLFPVTTLTTLTKKDKLKLLDKGIVLCKDICENPKILEEVGIERTKHKKIMNNVNELSNSF